MAWGIPVPTIESAKNCLFDTLSLLLLHQAPFPLDAQKNSFVIGLKITPSVISLSTIFDTTIPINGIPWIKFVVPSIGSITMISSLPSIFPFSSEMYVDLG